jgi:hypothetical protein
MQQNQTRVRLVPLLVKALLLFALVNFAFLWLPDAPVGKLSLYNSVFPGRERLPYGEVPQSYSLSPSDIDTMFASHVIAGAEKTSEEYRVLLIGDSSVWGTLLKPEETLAGQLNASAIAACGRNVRAYNLGYPTLSLLKELLLLEHALRYQPDMVIWLTTLESFPKEDQLTSPVVSNNAERVQQLITKYQLPIDPHDPALIPPSRWDYTLIGQRRAIADVLRLQIYGALWSATGIDQVYPKDYVRAQIDLEPSDEFHDLRQKDVASLEKSLAFEPILISNGANSDIRYNFFYPRWAYDEYRRLLRERSAERGWSYFDFWDLAPMTEFTNSGVHLTPAGEALLTARMAEAIQSSCK